MHPLTFLRIIVFVLASYFAAFALPATDDLRMIPLLVGGIIVVSLVLSTLTMQAMERRRQLLSAVRLELNKLRRTYHISKNLSIAAPQRFRGWFTDIHGFLYEYLNMFTGKDFRDYDRSNGAFRKLSYHVYTIPEMQTPKEQVLFEDLLHTTGLVAESRQHIKELWDNRLSFYGWVVVTSMVIGMVAAILLTLSAQPYARFVSGTVVACIVLSWDILWRVDSLSAERKALPKRYVANVARLELGRR